MTTKNDGGPAYPCENLVQRDDKGCMYGHPITSAGLSVRDYFAASVMGHLVCSPLRQENTISGDAQYAYKAADAMLAAREAV